MGASLPRRNVLIGVGALALSGCAKSTTMTASRTPPLDVKALDAAITGLVARARPGLLGFALMNLESGQMWSLNGEHRFPMQSVFKAPLGAAVLAEVDAGRLRLDESITLTDKQLSPPRSPIAEAWPARMLYTVEALLVAAVSDSDNTAADVLMKRIGGPGAVTAWLQSKDLNEIRVDRYERELQPEMNGMASFRPAWTGAAFAPALATVAAAQRRAAIQSYLRDPRDTATPRGTLVFLSKLAAGELLSTASTHRLLGIMARSTLGAERLKAGLPATAVFAHKTGASGTYEGLTAAYNDVGIVTLSDRRNYAAAAFLTASTADEAARADLLADLGRAIVRGVG